VNLFKRYNPRILKGPFLGGGPLQQGGQVGATKGGGTVTKGGNPLRGVSTHKVKQGGRETTGPIGRDNGKPFKNHSGAHTVL